MTQKMELSSKEPPAIIVIPPDDCKKRISMRTYRQSFCLLAIGVCAAVFLIFFYTYQHSDHSAPVFANTRLGVIEGIEISRHMGKTVAAFYGIPYAEPPIGYLRFKKPIPKRGWGNNVLKAKTQPPACYQLDLSESDAKTERAAAKKLQTTPQSEDCLFLNVFVPGEVMNQTLNQTVRNPVMIWIHGGAFLFGSLSSSDPSQLAVFGEVIVVSITYRLGIFGFLHSTDPSEAPGNVGLHDQTMAIKWVYDNIDSFGGDRNSITLFGESAGGISIGYHIISKHSQKYFKRAIMQSGSPLTMMIVGIDSGPLNVAKVAQALSCPFTSRKVTQTKYAAFNKKTYECLRDADADSLRSVEKNLLRKKKTFGFTPTQDRDFFPEGVHPLEFFRSSNRTYTPYHENQKEILLGSNGNEGASFLSRFLPSLFPKTSMLPANLSYEMIQQKLVKYAPGKEKEIRIIFDSIVHEDHKENPLEIALKFSKMIGDMAIMCPNIVMMDSFLKGGRNRTAFNYHFNVRPMKGRTFPWVKSAMHTEEIQFVMGYPFSQKAKYNHAERKLSIRMMKYWSNFARYGAPNHRMGEERDWPACSDDEDGNEIRWHKVFSADHSEKTVNGLPDNRCEHFEPLVEEMREKYRYTDL